MASKEIWRCIICRTEADSRPPRHCPKCGSPAARWRLVVDRAPDPLPAAAAPEEIDPATHTVEMSEAEALT